MTIKCIFSGELISTDICNNCLNKTLCLLDNYNIDVIDEDNSLSMETLIEISKDLSL